METKQDMLRDADRTSGRIGQGLREVGDQAQSRLGETMHQEPLQGAWEAMERIPVGVYYFAMLGSIAAALGFFASGKKDTAHFIGHWAPTFALLGLMNKLLRPARS
jgi:hypothetical protein